LGTTQTGTGFYRPDVLPVAQQAVPEDRREVYNMYTQEQENMAAAKESNQPVAHAMATT